MTLDYRSPRTTDHRVRQVLDKLGTVHSITSAGIVLKLLLGIPLTLLGPLIVTAGIRHAYVREQRDSVFNWVGVFFLVSLVMVPLLMWLERRTRGKFLNDPLMGEDISRPSSYGEFELRGHRTLWAIYTEFALYGPRLLWSVIDCFRTRTMVDSALLVVAAHVVVDLLDRGEAMNVRELIAPGRPGPMLVPALRFLQECDWVDTSRRRDRVWLRSPIRNRLANL